MIIAPGVVGRPFWSLPFRSMMRTGLPVTFNLVAVDSALAPPGTFSITLCNGYTLSGTLLSGSVQVR